MKEILEKNFGELNNIHIKYMKFNSGVAGVRYNPFRNVIYLDPIIQKFPQEIIEYILIHELIHLRDIKQYGLMYMVVLALVSPFWKGLLRKIEKDTDKECIKLGYGFALLKYNILKKNNPKLFAKENKISNLYLTEKEIRDLI